ncbi:ankyrin repeat domain-containing protein [Candidatus Lariskella endosymbiont of Epinotia ramella]|uniref:ankyrin repeat domain-containing protein n=1 Tax=Candidatus Lariskella endosymbiont of Epinotia ramella TaxID=3066224 RepID=UPI0030CCE358
MKLDFTTILSAIIAAITDLFTTTDLPAENSTIKEIDSSALRLLVKSHMSSNTTSLDIAVKQKNMENMNALLANGVKVSEYAVNIAVSQNDSETVALLLKHDVNIDRDVMESAVRANNITILKLLLKNGGNVDTGLVEIALIKNHKKALKLLLKHCDKVDKDIVRTIVRHNGYKELESLIKKEEKISEYAAKYALAYRNIKILKLLIENGWKITEGSMHNVIHSAVYYAIESNRFEILKLLLENGAKADESAVYQAALDNNSELTELLFSNLSSSQGIEYTLYNMMKKPSLNSFLGNISLDFDYKTIMRGALQRQDTNLVQELFHDNVPISGILLGVSNILDMWSSNVLEAVKPFAHSNYGIHILPLSQAQQNDTAFLKEFSGFINPGAGDSFPNVPFTLQDIQGEKMLENEKLYQSVLNVSNEFGIPYLGICSGAQHLILNKGGKLDVVANKHELDRRVTFIKGTFPHFAALTKAEQNEALEKCVFSDVVFPVYRAHEYSGVQEQLGDVKLGAVSKEGVVQAVASKTGQLGVQFHPENSYYEQTDTNRNKLIIDNFFERIKKYSEAISYAEKNGITRTEAVIAIKNAYTMLSDRLEECTYVAKYHVACGASYNDTSYETLFMDEFDKVMFGFSDQQ